MRLLNSSDLQNDGDWYYIGDIAEVDPEDAWVDREKALDTVQQFNELNNLKSQLTSTSFAIQIFPDYPEEIKFLHLN